MHIFTLPLLTTLSLASPTTPLERGEPGGTWVLNFFNGTDGCKGKVYGASSNEAVICQKVHRDNIKSYSLATNGWSIQLYPNEDCKTNPPSLPLSFPPKPADEDKPRCWKNDESFTKERPINAFSVSLSPWEGGN